LKTKKSELLSTKHEEKGNVFTGYGLISTKLDVGTEIPSAYENTRNESTEDHFSSKQKTLTQVDLTSSLPTVPTMATIKTVKHDTTLEELRNYIVLMDQYSLHNFLIYEGKTLKDTPEFQSFQRTYQYKWGSISSIIYQLEEYMSKNDIKLAIINGPRVFDLAKLNLPMLKKPELHSCIANIEQIELTSASGNEMSKKQMVVMIVRIQSLIRTFLCLRRFKRKRKALKSAVKIQSIARYMITRAQYRLRLRDFQIEWDRKFKNLQDNFSHYWKRASHVHNSKETVLDLSRCLNENEFTETSNITSHDPVPDLPLNRELSFQDSLSKNRLIILLPSISASQYLRLDYENFAALENTLISNLYLLADESVHLIYVSPFLMTNYQISYHEKFLSLMGISILPKRLTIITPELIEKLPPHLTLAQQLWCSSVALNRIRQQINHHKKTLNSYSYLVCSSLTWAEKRIANYLNIPILGPDPLVAETVCSRSFLKNLFFQTGINYPIGSHDIYSQEDLLLALTRLIAANLGIIRWNIKLNYDYNAETSLILDVEKIPLILDLRTEQFSLLGDKDNTASWFSRPVQLAVRKRILTTLQREFVPKVKICRKDILGGFELFSRLLKLYGAVIEAEPIEKLGYIVSMVFISPVGEITIVCSAQEYVDDFYQVQAYCVPQSSIPPIALTGVSHALATKLFQEFGIIGYVNLRFISLWDDLDQQPRLWATDVRLGLTPLHGAYGTASVVTPNLGTASLSFNLIPVLPEGTI
jgi:hypothetical protein